MVLAVLLLFSGTVYAADSKVPIIIFTTHKDWAQQVQNALPQDSWDVTIAALDMHGMSIHEIEETKNSITRYVDKLVSKKRGVTMLLVPSWVDSIVESVATEALLAKGVSLGPVGVNRKGITTIFSIDNHFAMVIASPCVFHHNSRALINALPKVHDKILKSTAGTGTTRGNPRQKMENLIRGITPPKSSNSIPQIVETNDVILLPPATKVLEVNGVDYPTKNINGVHVAILPKNVVPPYFTLGITGVRATIVRSTPKKANATCADLTYVTLCSWTQNQDNTTTVTISAASRFVQNMAYDLYIPKSVANSIDQVVGNYITIVKDPVLRIYLHVNENNIAVDTVRITKTNATFAPTGIISFGACDATVSDLNVIPLGNNKYSIQFLITDHFTPIYAQSVILHVDNRLVIPQRDADISGYSVNITLPTGEHTITVSAKIPGCGEVRYEKRVYTGMSNTWNLWIKAIIAVIVAYIVLKIVVSHT